MMQLHVVPMGLLSGILAASAGAGGQAGSCTRRKVVLESRCSGKIEAITPLRSHCPADQHWMICAAAESGSGGRPEAAAGAPGCLAAGGRHPGTVAEPADEVPGDAGWLRYVCATGSIVSLAFGAVT